MENPKARILQHFLLISPIKAKKEYKKSAEPWRCGLGSI